MSPDAIFEDDFFQVIQPQVYYKHTISGIFLGQKNCPLKIKFYKMAGSSHVSSYPGTVNDGDRKSIRC